MVTFINNHQLPFVVQQVGTMVQIKPFAGYYIWLDWFDLAPLDQSAAIVEIVDGMNLLGDTVGTLVSDVITAQAAADAAQSTANTGVTNAATAQAAADAAQSTANAAAQKHGRTSIFWDEAQLVTGTRTYSRVAGMDYGYGVSAAGLINNEMQMSFFCDISLGGTFHFHVVTNNASGIMTASIDGTAIGTIDLYTSVQTLNVDKTLTVDFGDFSPGRHTLKLKGAAKNGSSSGYFLVVTKVWFYDGSD